MAIITDPIMQPPFYSGHAQAWRSDLELLRSTFNIKPEDDGMLDSWLVEAPWANLLWHSYWICLIHLRPMPDNRPTLIYLPNATHEIWVYALDPEKDRNEFFSIGHPSVLMPKNFAAQFIASDDNAARLKVEGAVKLICQGKLSPDTDDKRHWMHIFGDNMIKGNKAIVIPPKKGPQDLH